jgi:hypothetical protein
LRRRAGSPQRAIDYAAAATGLRHRSTIEYWKSAPYLAAFLRGYRVRQALDAAWDDVDRRRVLQTALKSARAAVLPLRDMEHYREIPLPSARFRHLVDETLGHGQAHALWVPPSLAPYAPGGRVESAAAHGATKKLVFSGWRVVPPAVTALLGYEAERRAAGAGRGGNTRAARKKRSSAQLLTLRYDATKGLQRQAVMALTYPSAALAAWDPYAVAAGRAHTTTSTAMLRAAREKLRPEVKRLAKAYAGKGRVDLRWYWAAPMLLDRELGVDVAGLLSQRDGLRSTWSGAAEDGGTALTEALRTALSVIEHPSSLGAQPRDLTAVLAQLALAGPGVVALRALRRIDAETDVRVPASRTAWGLRTLLNRPDAVLVVRTSRRRRLAGDAGAYWRDALDYCVEGALQGVVDEHVHQLIADHADKGGPAAIATAVAASFATTTDLQPLAVAADVHSTARASDRVERRRLMSRFAVTFGAARTEDDAGVHPETVRQALNSPFWPWVLVTTSVGQEGLDFHRYCHQLVHWNVPRGPVELEQREGRVTRYLNHAVRRNIAERHRSAVLDGTDPWKAVRERAAREASDLIGFRPEWVLDGARHKIRRLVPVPAYSRDHQRFARVSRARVYYRLVLGQPNPNELVETIMSTLPADEAERLRPRLALNLSPRRPGTLEQTETQERAA